MENNCSVAKINNFKEGDEVPLCEGCNEVFSKIDCIECQKEFILTGVVSHSHNRDGPTKEEMEIQTLANVNGLIFNLEKTMNLISSVFLGYVFAQIFFG